MEPEHKRLETAGNQLSERLEKLSVWINKYGRVSALVRTEKIVLATRRDGKVWRLFVGEGPEPDRLFEQTPLKLKLDALGLLPDLLTEIKRIQSEYAAQVENAIQEFDRVMEKFDESGNENRSDQEISKRDDPSRSGGVV